MFRHRIKTRYQETGQDGIIHHTSYVVYLEEARHELFRKLNCGINALEKKQIFCPVVDLFIKYKKPLYSFEEVFITTGLKSLSKVRFELFYAIYRESEIIGEATTMHCFVNGRFKPIAIPGEIYKAFMQLNAEEAGELLLK